MDLDTFMLASGASFVVWFLGTVADVFFENRNANSRHRRAWLWCEVTLYTMCALGFTAATAYLVRLEYQGRLGLGTSTDVAMAAFTFVEAWWLLLPAAGSWWHLFQMRESRER